MGQQRRSLGRLKAWSTFLSILVHVYGYCMLGVSIWMQADPRRRVVLDYVNFYENDPLLKTAVHVMVACGVTMLIASILSCIGAANRLPLLLLFCCILLAVLSVGAFVAFLLSLLYLKNVLFSMDGYLYDLVHRRYSRQQWVTELVDAIQFYHKCCGSNDSTDYRFSYWQITKSPGAVSYVPSSCCTQQLGAYPPDHLLPIDGRCSEFPYAKHLPTVVHVNGCYNVFMSWLSNNCAMVAGLAALGTALLVSTLFVQIRLFRRAVHSVKHKRLQIVF